MEEKLYVRNTAGKVFGPIDSETLKGWVKDGRVEPLAGVSSDLVNWVVAPSRPELEMNWIVENNAGQFYGPTHRAVLDDLVKAGALSSSARFFLDDRGAAQERIRSLESALAAKDAELSQRDATLAEAQRLSVKKDLQLAAGQKAVRERDDRIAEMNAALRQRDAQLAELTKAVQNRDGMLQQRADELARRDAEREALVAEIANRDAEIALLKEQLSQRDAIHEREWKAEVVEPEIVVNEAPPVVARQAFAMPFADGTQQTAALVELERRAQQELARMGASGVKKFFRMRK